MSYDMNTRSGISYMGAFFILLGLLGVGLFFGSLAAAGIWLAMTGKDIFSMEKEMMNPANAEAVRVLQLVSTFFIFFLPAWFTALILSRKPGKFLGLNFYFSSRQVLMVIGIMILSLPVVGALSELNELIPIPAAWEKMFRELEASYNKQVEVLSNIKGFGDYLLSLLIMALAPALFEETFFRGGMQQILQKWTRMPWLAILVTSLVFSAIHFSWYGFVPRFALGLVLGMIYYFSGSLWLSVTAHFFNNALVVTLIYVNSGKGKPVEEIMNESWPIWTGIAGGILLVLLMYLFGKVSSLDRKKLMPAEDLALEEKWIA